MIIIGTHIETIKCPECGEIQNATVEHTLIWNSYVHECQKCKYVIMESEWDKIEQPKKQNNMTKVKAKFPVQFGQSITCDFRERTWTFEMPEGFGFTGGTFAIITTEDYEYMKEKISRLKDPEIIPPPSRNEPNI